MNEQEPLWEISRNITYLYTRIYIYRAYLNIYIYIYTSTSSMNVKFHEGSVFWEQGYFVGIDDLKGVSWND